MKTKDSGKNAQILQRKLTLLVRVGMVLMESAADSNRIVRNMKRVAAFLGLEEQLLHIDVLYGTIKVSYCDEEHSYSRFMHSDKYTINMKSLAAVSSLSWRAIREDYSVKKFARQLQEIQSLESEYPTWLTTLGAAFGCGGFSVLFGGDWPSFLPAAIAGFVGFSLRYMMLKERFNFYMLTAATAFIATLTAWLMYLIMPAGFSSKPYHPFLCCALFLVPGVALINFLDDMLDNYLLVGIARLGNAAVQIAAMTFGIVLAVSVCDVTDFLTDLSMVPIISYWEAAIVTGMCLRNLIAIDWGQGMILGSLAGASLISLLATRLVHATRSPNHVLTIPGVIPMVPGILMYRGIFGFVHLGNDVNEFMIAFSNLLNASLIVLCLSIGVALPNIFARRWIAASRRTELKRLIEERKERGKFIDISDFD